MAPRLALLMLKLSMALILATWICIWILRPTMLWKRSWHTAEDEASNTFFGAPGLNVVVFCFPLLAVATLVYIYLHLYGRISRQRASTKISLSNPSIVNSPIGIVSRGELLAVGLFIVFLAWTYYSNVSTDFKKLTPPKPLKLNRWQLKVFRLGVRFGSLTEACLVLLLLPVLRGMALFRILGIQFEAAIRYHVWLGNGIMLFSLLHGISIMSVWSTKKCLLEEITKWPRTGRVNLAGLITLASAVMIWLTSLPPIRRKQFQFFYFAHHLYMVFIVFFLFHGGDQHFFLVFSGVLLFALNKILRIMQSRQAMSIISARILPCRAVELTLPKHPSMKYSPTSMVFMKIPSISKFQWHPFSIISSSSLDVDRYSVLIKCQGQWTDSLYNLVRSVQDVESNNVRKILVSVEGPYGPAIFPNQRYDSLLLIAGGSGITPFLSMLQDIASRNHQINNYPGKVQLIYVVKRLQDLSMLTSIAPLLLNQSTELGHLKLKLFVTREDRSGTTAREVLQEMYHVQLVNFDANPSVDSVARPEGMLLKAIITGVSFFVFLASLVCLSHFCIQKEKSASQDKTPSWISNILLICSFVVAFSCSIMITAFARWRKSAKGSDDISHMHPTPAELDSLKAGPVEMHEISFGKRPNMTELLSELASEGRDSQVGVFVCGPDSMQVSVASFCSKYSQTTKENNEKHKCRFAFHSINFSL